jgi:hypothetical protein
MNEKKYPLEQLIEIKKKRVEDAEKVFIEKKKIHEKQVELLKKEKEKKEEINRHYEDKLEEFYTSFDKGTTSDKIKMRKDYLKKVLEDLKNQDQKVKQQAMKVETALQEKNDAKKILDKRRQDVEKIETHEVEWQKTRKKEEELKKQAEHDELSSSTYDFRKKRKKKEGF